METRGEQIFRLEPYAVVSVPFGAGLAGSVEEEVLGLFDEFRASLLRYAVSFGLTLHDGEDLIQEVFLALFRHLQMGRPRENLRGWVFRVTHNLALKRRVERRKELNSVEFEEEHERTGYFSTVSPEEELLFQERQMLLMSVFRALPERDRWCLQLRAEGLKYREIAAVVGISLGAVSSSLAYSLGRLARMEAR